jgi:hypothetical protein
VPLIDTQQLTSAKRQVLLGSPVINAAASLLQPREHRPPILFALFTAAEKDRKHDQA